MKTADKQAVLERKEGRNIPAFRETFNQNAIRIPYCIMPAIPAGFFIGTVPGLSAEGQVPIRCR